VKEDVTKIWRQYPNSSFTGKLRRLTKFYKMFYIRKVGERRAAEEVLRIEIVRL